MQPASLIAVHNASFIFTEKIVVKLYHIKNFLQDLVQDVFSLKAVVSFKKAAIY